MVWDPTYKVTKKKTKEELEQSRLESVQYEPAVPLASVTEYIPNEPPNDDHEHVKYEIEKDENVTWYKQATPNVLLAKTDDQLNYVLNRPSHVACSRQIELYKCRSTNVFLLIFLVLLMPQLAMGSDMEKERKEADLFGTLVMTVSFILLSTAFPQTYPKTIPQDFCVLSIPQK